MADTQDLITALRAELKVAGMTYANLADALGTSESTVKRMFSRRDMTLSRVDEILKALSLDFADVARRIAQTRPEMVELSHAQEKALVADRKLMMIALSCQSEWSFEQMLEFFVFSEAQLVGFMTRLDKLGLIELRANNRYSLKLAKGFRWRPHGPVMTYFRQKAMSDYFSSGFDKDGELLVLVHGSIATSSVPAFNDRLRRLASDFSRQHLTDHNLDPAHKSSFTMVLAMRDWLYSEFHDLTRGPGQVGTQKPELQA
ncbi:MAG: helix-turn-helix transcriptional regulator [Burkholderiaceae bacterium]